MNDIIIAENEEYMKNNTDKFSDLDDELLEKDKQILKLEMDIDNIKKGFEKVLAQNSEQFITQK